MKRRSLGLLLTLSAFGCVGHNYIPGTTVENTPVNQQLIDAVEDYRHAMMDRDAEKLLSMASPNYFEDAGTPLAGDDYGLEGLKQILFSRLATVRQMRYDILFKHVEVQGNVAHVDIHYNASFEMATAMGDRWEHKDSDKRLVLENNGHRWLFLAGM